jgi:CubicO group peptidase (beta-lactamase class C family)
MKRFLSILSLLMLVAVITQSQPTTLPKRIQAVENNLIPYVPVKSFATWNIAERMKYYHIPSVSMAVIKDFKIDYIKTYGEADTLLHTKATPQTVYSAGSISKLVTAVIALKMVEQGLLNLDAPINNYLQSWKLAENDFTKATPITLRMLLSHTAGTSQAAYWGFVPSTPKLPTIVEVLSGAPIAESRPVVVNSEPNKEWRYSGGGYMVVQMAIMDVLKKDFNSIAQQYIFTPLGMSNSTFMQPLPATIQQRFANGYSAASWYKGVPYVYPQQAAAGLHTTPTDLALLIIALQKSMAGTSNFLSKPLANAMVQPKAQISRGSYNEDMGLGAFLLEQKGNASAKGKYFEHQGSNAGFISFAMGSVVGGNGVIIMMNSGDDFNAFGVELRRSVAKVYNWNNFLPPTIQPKNQPLQVLKEYEGRYRKGIDEVIYMKQEKNYLVETINEGRNIYCFTTGKDSIVFTDYNIAGFFTRDAKGKVASLRNMYQTQEQAMPKMKDDEFTPSEYLRAKNYAAAKDGFRQMKMNEYQITYLAYDLINKKNWDSMAVKVVLELAEEQNPNSSIVFSRWGDFYIKLKDKQNAIKSYQKALTLDPNDQQTKDALKVIMVE